MSDTNNVTKLNILDALYAIYKADELQATANLNNYLNNAAGIGEHPDIVAEAKKLVEKIGAARANLELVKSML